MLAPDHTSLEPEAHSAPTARWPFVVCAAAIVACVAGSIRFEWKLDDAYIAFAYAQNWVQGHGLVFNVGELVEGYTCFLWVALSALGLLLHANLVVWTTALGILSAVGTILVAWRLARELVPGSVRDGAVLVTLLVGAYPTTWWWAASGMETMLFTLLITTAVWRHIRDGADSLAAPVCLALASMTRPEGWLLAVLLCLDAFRLGSWRAGTRYAAAFLAIFAPYYAWRFWYYGYPLPNTFYAKVGHSSEQMRRGLLYVIVFVVLGAGGGLLFGAAVALFSGIARRTAGVYVFLVAYIGYVIAVGGDAFAFFRFLVPLVPVLAALTVIAILRGSHRRWPTRPRLAYGLTVAYVGMLLLCCVPVERQQVTDRGAAEAMNEAQWQSCVYLRGHTAPDDAIASIGIGVIKYCTQRRVIDMLGLTDAHIAHRPVARMGQTLAGHEKFDSEYVLAQRPRYILIPQRNYFPYLPASEDMWQQPEFLQHYREERFGFRRID